MLISKNYLKQIIKEEIERITEGGYTFSDEVLVEMPSEDFLDLTTNDQEMKKLENDLLNKPINYKKVEAGKLLLNIDSSGRVESHEGRHRALANLQKNNKENDLKQKEENEKAKKEGRAPMDVTTPTVNTVIVRLAVGKYKDFLNSGLKFTGQFNSFAKKDPKKYPIIEDDILKGDFLEAEKEPRIFEPTIRAPIITPQRKIDEYVEEGYRKAILAINMAQFEYVRAYKKKLNIEYTRSSEERFKLAKDFEKYANENYKVYAIDQKGNKKQNIKIVDVSKSSVMYSLEPLPDPKDTVVIEKK